MADASKIRSTLVELFSRLIEVNDKNNVYSNGADNNYPKRIERIINNSTTAKMSANKLGAYIFGKGFSEIGEVVINKQKNLTFNQILHLIATSVKVHKGYYLHINYDALGKVNYLDVLPYSKCRITKDDDLGYSNAIYYSDEWGEQKFSFNRKSKKAKWFYPYNDDIKVITAQRERDAKSMLSEDDNLDERVSKMVTNYRGQVVFVNLEPENIYPLAYIDSSYNDADSEYRASIYKNGNLRSGFVGKMVATILQSGSKKEKELIEGDLSGLLGAENTGNIMVFESKLDQDGKLIPVIQFDKIESNINDKLHAYTEESIKKKILMAYSINPALVLPSHSLFGTSGEAMKEIKMEFQNSNILERMTIEGNFKRLFDKDFTIIPLIEEEVIIENKEV